MNACEDESGILPMETVAGGSYASTANAEQARENGVRRAVFNIRYGLGYHKMGVKKKRSIS